MTRRARQMFLGTIAAVLTVALVLFLANREVAKKRGPPSELPAMAAWIAEHPADWQTAMAIAETALDTSLPKRVELWRASYALARSIAPRRENPSSAFVRGGLFHWYELSPADRRTVLEAAAPLMRDHRVFDDLHRPLWELTRDFEWLRRNAPQSINALDALQTIATRNGLFAEYRGMREAMRRHRLAQLETGRSAMAAHELPLLLPRPIDASYEPLVRRILEELKLRSFEPQRFGDPTPAMIEYALRHQLPLDGLAPFIEAGEGLPAVTRARLALALGQIEAASRIELAAPGSASAEWTPYHLERAEIEARRGNPSEAAERLRMTLFARTDAETLAAAERIATMLRDDAAAAQFRRQLRAQPREWSGTCGRNELCGSARMLVHTGGEPFALTMDVVQSDQIAPYVEIYAGDVRVAEGEVADQRRFTIPLTSGVHRIEVRLVNPAMANGIQRRVRLS